MSRAGRKSDDPAGPALSYATRVKRLVELTAEDLATNPVWRYEGGSGTNALLAPSKRASLSQMDDEIFLAATEFVLVDSSRHSGFCFPADDSGIDYLQPVIVGDSGHVAFWFDVPPTAEVLSRQWRAFGKEPGEIFPVEFRCTVPVDGRTVSGSIHGVESSRDLTSGPTAAAIASEPESPGEMDRILTARPVQARRDTGAVEKRTARRRKAEMTVEFTEGAFRGTGTIGDLSHRGMFVRSSRVPGTGAALRLTVNLPEGRTIILTGRVVRSEEGPSSSRTAPGFGLRLAEDSADYQDLLWRLRNKRK